MQSAFLHFFDDALLPHRLGPLATPAFEVSSCFFKRLPDLFLLLLQSENVLFAALNLLSRCGLEVGNSCPRIMNLPIDLVAGIFQFMHFHFGLLHIRFGDRHVRLPDLE